jgi:DNA (cytosine-5)-methyltransferase 1
VRFGSVCSGIEAASVAWGPLGWKAAWLSEIEPFPSTVLAHHYPDVPNLGDMTLLPERILSGEVEAPDVFCGGTPCQAFSVAGLRNSLDDARGNLSLVFCEIANAIDEVRSVRGLDQSIVFWENVPGVLSTKDNAFGCFLAGLAGEDNPLEPPREKWTNAGYVLGPKRAVAWRVLDAQYFGVAQRRKRVFVVASARADFDPAAVLFEFDGVRRDTAPSREAGERIAPCVTNGPPFSRTGNERVEAEAMVVAARMVAFGEYSVDGTASAMKARDYKDATDLVAGALAVRRLTPTECERLQGFPDNYTNIKNNCPDAPRYKVLGNSWAVPNVRWIGERIAKVA